MKKILPILIVTTFLAMISLGTIQVQAETTNNADVEVTLEGATDITQGTRTLELTLRLGNMIGVEQGNVMAFDTTLEYSPELFTSVSVTEQNGWDVTYEDSTKKLVGITDEGTGDKDIAQITLILKDDIAIGAEGSIKLKNFTISDDENLSKKIDEIKKDVKIVQDVEKPNVNEQYQAPNVSENNSENESQANNNERQEEKQTEVVKAATTEPAKGLEVEEPTQTATLPKAGLQNLIIIAIVVIGLIGIGSFIREKSIKLK